MGKLTQWLFYMAHTMITMPRILLCTLAEIIGNTLFCQTFRPLIACGPLQWHMVVYVDEF